MSELINKHDNRATIRWKLLTGASALALTAYVSTTGLARAEDASQPQIWIELGGSFDQLDNSQGTFTPPFMAVSQPFRDFSIPEAEKPSRSGFDLDGSITFQPENSDWVLSASIVYGRSKKRGHLMHAQPQASCFYSPYLGFSECSTVYAYANAIATNGENHMILDFKAGKDVGLGLIKDATSVLSAGLRYAQFRSDMTAQMSSKPQNSRRGNGFEASLTAARSFTGIGPAISWDASAPIAGNADAGQISLDWGVDAALLFGRQKAKAHHETLETHYSPHNSRPSALVYDHIASPARSKSVSVPNLGGFAGLSLRYANAKVSFGYRADMFFSAVDAGIDTAKKEDRGFYGPFASISVGIGD